MSAATVARPSLRRRIGSAALVRNRAAVVGLVILVPLLVAAIVPWLNDSVPATSCVDSTTVPISPTRQARRSSSARRSASITCAINVPLPTATPNHGCDHAAPNTHANHPT